MHADESLSLVDSELCQQQKQQCKSVVAVSFIVEIVKLKMRGIG